MFKGIPPLLFLLAALIYCAGKKFGAPIEPEPAMKGY